MKVYAAPDSITLKYDYGNYDRKVEDAKEKAYVANIKAWLVERGYKGPRTGDVISFGVADGSAQYMYGDAGTKSILIHLALGDAYQYGDVAFLPRKEVLRRLMKAKDFQAMFE